MRVAFVGEEKGMTDRQRRLLKEQIVELGVSQFHHCGRKGADLQAQSLVLKMLPDAKVVIHPAGKKGRRRLKAKFGDVAKFARRAFNTTRFARMFCKCRVLIAAPAGKKERKSFLWKVVRQARLAQKNVIVLYPGQPARAINILK